MDIKKEAGKQYLHYFRFWFLAAGALAVICIVLYVWKPVNQRAPEERVYDYADVLTKEEEENLRERIARMEQKERIHIVLVTISQSMEGAEAEQQYGYRYTDWERNMQDYADDFWDEHMYGWNKGYEGDGVLLLHNWYPGQNGQHLSTSGKAERAFDIYDIDDIMDEIDAYYESSPYKAYSAYVDKVCELLEETPGAAVPRVLIIVLPLVAAGIYAACNLRQKKAENTTAVNAYVAGGKPVLNSKSDDFLRKSVTTRRIETSSSGGGGRSGGGGGGHHHSSSGAGHGGGSRRH